MEVETVCEALDYNALVTRLTAKEDFIDSVTVKAANLTVSLNNPVVND
jgi:hypothetical protein